MSQTSPMWLKVKDTSMSAYKSHIKENFKHNYCNRRKIKKTLVDRQLLNRIAEVDIFVFIAKPLMQYFSQTTVVIVHLLPS